METKAIISKKSERPCQVTVRYRTVQNKQDIQTEVEIDENGNKGHNKQKIRAASSRDGTVQKGTARYKTCRQRYEQAAYKQIEKKTIKKKGNKNKGQKEKQTIKKKGNKNSGQ